MNRKRIYSIWKSMVYRCRDESRKHYFGKGVRVCSAWENSFEAFHSWAIQSGYDDSKTIDRKDGNKGYSPKNCRWATYGQQAWNKSDTRKFELNGEMHTGLQLQKLSGVPAEIIRQRVNLGWNVFDAIHTPYTPRRRIKFQGRKVTITELSKQIGMNYNKLKYRITKGWPIEEAIKG